MKTKSIIMTLVLLASVSFFAHGQGDLKELKNGARYEGEWPNGKGVLYSYKDGLVFGTFSNGKPEGRCVCYKPNGEVYWGDFKNGKYHGIDTLYRRSGATFIAKFKKGKLKERISDSSKGAELAGKKPEYPRIDFRRRQQEFLNELELRSEERNAAIRSKAGLINPEFQGGTLSDFTYWVNSQINVPVLEGVKDDIRTVVVEFVVYKDGSVRDVHALFGTHPELNDEAVRVVCRSPKWKPAEQGGQKKSVKLTVPVVFEF